VTQNFTARANVYAYYGRLFTPFPLDTLILPTLRPQRDSLYEFGGQAPLGAFDLGLRIMHKRSDDVIDDAQLATTNIRESVSFADGITDLQSLLVQRRTKTGGRDFVTLTHGRATVRGCTTSILVSCFAPNWIAADADQRWSATAGQYISAQVQLVKLDRRIRQWPQGGRRSGTSHVRPYGGSEATQWPRSNRHAGEPSERSFCNYE